MILSILEKADVILVNNCHIGNVGWSGLDNVKYVYEISRHYVDSFLIFTTCKRSLGQGNFFDRRLSVHGGSLYDITSCLAAWSHIPSGESLSKGAGGSLPRGSLSREGSL